MIGKALTLSEAIARSDRGPLPKLKEMIKSIKVEHVTEGVSSALERMNKEILRPSPSGKLATPWSPHCSWGRKKTPEDRRENNIVKGTVSLFSGVGLMIFLYYLSLALVLKVPPYVLADIPFELDPVVRMIWLVGLIPTLSAGLVASRRNALSIAQTVSHVYSLSVERPSRLKSNQQNMEKN